MNNTAIQIQVANIIGNVYAVEAEEGQKVYEIVKKAFEENRKVILSFLNIEMTTTAFLNAAIGQLYGCFSEETVKERLRVENISESGKIMLKRVVETAKLFYNDSETFIRMQQSINEILNQE